MSLPFYFGGDPVYVIITNNPKGRVWQKLGEGNHVIWRWQQGGTEEVLLAARDLIHLGWQLVNHPLASSIKPNQSPYKTLVLEKGEHVELQSLQLIDGALATVNKFGPFTAGKHLEDLQLIDFEVAEEAIRLVREGVSKC